MGFSITSFAQHSMGANIGYFGYKDSGSFKTIGLKYQITNPCDTCEELNIYMVSSYDLFTGDNNNMISYSRTSLGFDLYLGNKLFFVIGGGLAGQVLIKNSSHYTDYKLKPFVFSANVNTGVGFKISKRFFTTFLGQYYIDISPSAITKRPNHFGPPTEENVHNKFYFFQLNLNYFIKK
jgi:hypothetical protein